VESPSPTVKRLGLDLCSHFQVQLHRKENQNKECIINKLSRYLVQNQRILGKSVQF